ncbi:MAG: PepSY-associated TM helix domain-containing protein [Prevotella sp.]|nr:PepSY-associated TM helix domain-containing protein [Prevotella sp.]
MKKAFRKIHLWLSVPTGIIITLVCFSGAMLVFEKEITEAIKPELYFVKEAKGEPIPMQQLMEKVEETLPDSVSISGVTVFADSTRTYQVSLTKPRRASIYVNQYTGEVTGRSERLPFFNTMFHLHRWLMGSSSGVGKLLTGICTLVLVFILITGILTWLTNRHKPLKASLAIHVTKGWGRFWHDLHVAGGIYATIFLLAMALTGLTWSFSWYRTGFYSCFGVESSAEGSAHGGSASIEGQRGGERGGNDRSGERQQGEGRHGYHGDGEGHGYHGGGEGYHGGSGEGYHGDVEGHGYHGGHGYYHGGEGHDGGFGFHHRSPYRHWDNVMAEVAKKNPGYRQITLKAEAAEVVPEGRLSLRATDKYSYNRRSGEITDIKLYSSEGKDTKVRSGVYMVHTGSWGGLITRILNFLAALIGATLPLTGYWLWIRRLIRKRCKTEK